MNFSHFLAAVAAAVLSGSAACAQSAIPHEPNVPQLALFWNAADLLETGLLSFGAGVPLAQHLSANLDFKCRPWAQTDYGSTSCRHLDTTFQPGIRWWPWHVNSGIWVNTALKMKTLRTLPNNGDWTRSHSYGAVCTVGYAWMLGMHLNLNFGIGGGIGINPRRQPLSWRQAPLGVSGKWYMEYAEPVLGVSIVF